MPQMPKIQISWPQCSGSCSWWCESLLRYLPLEETLLFAVIHSVVFYSFTFSTLNIYLTHYSQCLLNLFILLFSHTVQYRKILIMHCIYVLFVEPYREQTIFKNLILKKQDYAKKTVQFCVFCTHIVRGLLVSGIKIFDYAHYFSQNLGRLWGNTRWS